jgi:hypothetical protein
MGGGSWDDNRYSSATATRAATKTPDFAYSATATHSTTPHDSLDPMRINKKPFGKLESRDSTEHPESNAVLVCFDVTGSNYNRAVEAQKKLPNLMTLLQKYLTDPQVAIAANDDYNVEPHRSVQISDFESDNRIDDSIRNVLLVGNGGGNHGESYDLLLYAAARKTVLDCFEKRKRKGYMFLYADEPIFKFVTASQVKAVFGDNLQGEIPIAEIIEEVREQYHLFLIWPEGGYPDAREQYEELLGQEYVLRSQHPNLICELIAATVAMNEDRVAPADVKKDLLSIGASSAEADNVITALATIAKSKGEVTKTTGAVQASSAAGADRL